MIDNPYETKSDSFYFVNGKLIMHNKASYKVIDGFAFIILYSNSSNHYLNYSTFGKIVLSPRKAMKTSSVPR